VDNPTGRFELATIDESKSIEYTGRGFALMKWGGQMKFMVPLCVFLNVLVAPWGLAAEQTLEAVLLAIPLVLFRIFCFVLVPVLDYNGTLAVDGALLPRLKERLESLTGALSLQVPTADTFGTCRADLAGVRCGEFNLPAKAHVQTSIKRNPAKAGSLTP